MRILVLLLMVVLTGCQAGASGQACTAIGALRGIAVDVAPSVAARFDDSTSMQVCWNDSCQTRPVVLSPATVATDSTCVGDTCSARMRETGGKTGFADVPELTGAPARVTFADETVTVTPELVYPNGPDCGAGGPQAKLVVDGTGVHAAGR